MPTLADMEAAVPKCQYGMAGKGRCMAPLAWSEGDAEDQERGGVWSCKRHRRQVLGCEFAAITTGTLWFEDAAA